MNANDDNSSEESDADISINVDPSLQTNLQLTTHNTEQTPTIINLEPPTLKNIKKNDKIEKIDKNEKNDKMIENIDKNEKIEEKNEIMNENLMEIENSPLMSSQLSHHQEEKKSKGPHVDPLLLKLMNISEQSTLGTTIDNECFDFDIENVIDKPWNAPNADITDYFNYGFEEESWRDYCMAQIKMRMILKQKHENKLQKEQLLKQISLQFPTNHLNFNIEQYKQQQLKAQMQLQQSTQPQSLNLLPNQQLSNDNNLKEIHPFSNPFVPNVFLQESSNDNNKSPAINNINNLKVKQKSQNIPINSGSLISARPIVVNTPQIIVQNNPKPNNDDNRKRICFDYQNKGQCTRGTSCRWSHDIPSNRIQINQPNVCFEYQNKGSCLRGPNCRWRH